ncbi:MAG: DUF2207 domain-containing protein [Actinomycetota bacterium]|nr:DUF2207 domain-containing protein [Actinomycetota bacterium]
MARLKRTLLLKVKARLYPLLALALILMAGFSPSASAKDYTLPKLDIEIEVEKDGSFSVAEERTFAFDGTFSWAEYSLPLSYKYEIKDFSIQEGGIEYVRSTSSAPGTYELDRDQDSFTAKWYFSAKDSEKTFIIKYKILGGVDVYSDFAQFYWKFVGTGWTKPVERFQAVLRLPDGANKEEIRAWAHGPLTGEVEIVDGATVSFKVNDLPASTFVEGRVLFPLSLVPEAKVDFDEPILNEALAEETEWAEDANILRERAIADLEKRRQLESMGLASSIIVSAVGILFYAILWFLFGKEYSPSFDGDYFRELPAEYPPAVMGYLVKFGHVDTRDMIATLMDLARRGFLTIKEEELTRKILFVIRTEYDYNLKRMVSDTHSLNGYESNLLSFLFDEVGNGESVSIEELKDFAKAEPLAFSRFFEEWKKDASLAAKAHGFLERHGSVIALNVFVSLMLIGFGAAIMATWQIASGFIAIFFGVLQIVLSVFLRRRSPAAASDFKKWEAFKRFLLHFSNLKEALPSSMVIWEHYLVYAVSLGVAEKTIEQLKIVMPEILKEQGLTYFGPSWFESSRGLEGLGSLESFGQSLSSMVATANSAMSSASGGGGGFSGGGGGGGGGSGGGAG